MRQSRPELTAIRKGMNKKLREMAQDCQCSPGLLSAIEFDGWITHPHIAARIAAVYKLDLDGYNDLVSLDRKAKALPKPKPLPKATNLDQAVRAICRG